MSSQKCIVITGGHVTPALAVIDELRVCDPSLWLVMIGRKYTSQKEQKESFEYRSATSRQITFFHLTTGRLARHSVFAALYGLILACVGIIHSVILLGRIKPDIVFTCGGYIGFAVSVAALLRGIPVYLHEQTLCPGITSRVISWWARQIFTSFPSSKKFFPLQKVVWTGNPVRKSLFEKQNELLWQYTADHPLLYITGGSLGSHSLNLLVEKTIMDLLKRYTVVLQTGNLQETGDFDRLTKMRSSLTLDLVSRWHILSHTTDGQAAFLFQHAHLVVSRAGANILTELIAFRIPAVLVPLPWAAHDEQRKHAQWFVKHRLGEIFEQEDAVSHLLEKIDMVSKNHRQYLEHFTTLHETPFHPQAARAITDRLLQAI